MFNDRFGLTRAVLEGRKTMTRRIISEMIGREYKKLPQVREYGQDGSFLVFKDADDLEPIILYPKYNVGEVVAVAQKYKDMMPYLVDSFRQPSPDYMMDKPGYNNKMFVRADLMPHQIRITNVRVERLQDISDEDCLREGIQNRLLQIYEFDGWPYFTHIPREAFAALIDKVSGKGTWESDPWVFVYEFELVS